MRMNRAGWLTLFSVTALAGTTGAATVAAGGAAVGVAGGAAARVAVTECTMAAIQPMVARDTTIVSAERLVKPVPYCSIEGYVTTQNPGPNKVGFLLGLPEHGWNGRFFFNSVGGSAGFLQTPPAQLIVDGYAVATTDGGHRSTSILDWSELSDPAKVLDLSRRSMHVSAVAGQAITKAYYKAHSMYRYVQGCSGGGQRTLNSARHYPEDYDGFIVEAPGINAANILAFASATQYIARHPDAWVPPGKIAKIEQQVAQVCHAVGGVVPDSLQCKFEPASMQCNAEDKPDCLTAAQVKTVELIARGPRGPKGQLYPGAPYTDTTGWIGFFTGTSAPPWSETDLAKAPGGYIISHSFMRGYFGKDYDFVKQFDFDKQADIDAYFAADHKAQMGQNDADLSGVEKAGRKVIFWHGMSDPGISYADSVRYYEQLHRTLPGDGRVEKFARLFGAPGVLHCGGGSGPTDVGARALDKMTDWVEKGIAPEALVTARTVEHAQVRQFLLCQYPKVGVYKAQEVPKGDPMAVLRGDPALDASNWQCE
jgi:pimeloyl-ACP methyl ester carboxylesterase